LYKLGTYKVDQLKKEQSRLAEENKQVVEQTQDIAISNYKTFIQTSECSRVILLFISQNISPFNLKC
jgi:conserved oligomeric Golgi complex subunit 8